MRRDTPDLIRWLAVILIPALIAWAWVGAVISR